MNDFDYEVLQRKRLANQAKYRKRGSKSKKCSLPSDGMTQKQWKERNGEIMSYNLNKPMSWRRFKYMPSDLQRKYLEKLRDEHDATAKAVAEMLGITPNSFWQWRRQHEMLDIFPRNGGRQELPLWSAFLRGDSDDAVQETVAHEDAVMPCEPVADALDADVTPEPKAARNAAMGLRHFTLDFSGEFDPDAVRNSLAMMLEKGQKVNLTISCCVVPHFEPVED